MCEQQAAARVIAHTPRDGRFRAEACRAGSRIQRRTPGNDGDVCLVAAFAFRGDVDHQVADGDEPDHVARRRAASVARLSARLPSALETLPARRGGHACAASQRVSAARERPRRSAHTAWRAPRGGCRRPRQGTSAAARRSWSSLGSRRGPSGGVGTARRSDSADRELRQCECTSCGKRSASASMRTILRGSW